jgi:hypothetical protein
MGVVRMVRPWHEWIAGVGVRQRTTAAGGGRGSGAADRARPHRRPRAAGGHHVDLVVDRQPRLCHTVLGRPGVLRGRRRAPPPTVQRARLHHVRAGLVQPRLEARHGDPREAGPQLLETYSAERAPVGRQIVERANLSRDQFGPIFEVLGVGGGSDGAAIAEGLAAVRARTPEGAKKRRLLEDPLSQRNKQTLPAPSPSRVPHPPTAGAARRSPPGLTSASLPSGSS